jgi:bifunctional DNA-binding transcriptional regulator/antitoxin component of YhaV-PrlF toxin-antitoxin module
VTSSPIAPVIPPATRAPAGDGRGPRTARRLPLAGPLPAAGRDSDVVYGLGRMDASGRVADRAVISALGWRGGDRLTLTSDAGVILARRDPAGMITMPARPYLVIPAALRRRCHIRTGDRVLLAALPGQDTLAACPLAVVDQAIRAHAPIPDRQPGGRQ